MLPLGSQHRKEQQRRQQNPRRLLTGVLCALLVTTARVTVVSAVDYYKLLGVSRDATLKEIKKMYRQKSLEFHPDKNKEEGAAEKFAEIARAYEVLSDEDKKAVYDRYGEEGLKQHEEQGGGAGGGFGGGFEDIFSQFGFNFGGGRHRQDRGNERTPSVEMPLHLTMKQLYLGDTIEVQYVRQVLCLQWEMCVKSMPECQSAGVRVRRQQIAPGFVQQVQQRDERCVSRGKMWKEGCSACPTKTVTEKIDLTVDVSPGLRPGEIISFEGVTDERPGYDPGDLHFVIVEEPHPIFHRDRDDLYKTMEVPLVDALTGFSITLTHLDDQNFTVTVNTVTDCDHVMRVPGKGMPRRNGRGYGDLYLTFEVDFPDELSQAQKDEIRKILGPAADAAAGGSKPDEL
jgi:DnaJ-class molecular chaperone